MVAMITAASLLSSTLENDGLSYPKVLIFTALGAGSMVGTWMNDSGFWLFKTMTGLSETQTLKTKSATLAVAGLTAFAVTQLAAMMWPSVAGFLQL